MHRFFLPPDECSGQTQWLEGREARHALQVLRIRRGDPVTVLDGAGGEFCCETREASRDSVELRVLTVKRHEPPPCRLTLVQALPRGKLLEIIIQKATELGVVRIVPLLTERVVTKLDEATAGLRAGRWQQNAIEAIKQCGCPWLPVIEPPSFLKPFLARPQVEELKLVAALQADRRHVREVVGEFQRKHGRRPASVSLFVGPEGDFTPAELEALRQAGAHAITLGRNVLRADTAAVAGLAMLMSELDAPGP